MAKLQQPGTARPKARRPPSARRSANDQQRQELTDAHQTHAAIADKLQRVQAALRGSLEQQTATSEILKVIANSPSDVQPVFDAIASSAKKLIGAHSTTVYRFVDGLAHLAAFTPTTPEADAVLQSVLSTPVATAEPFTRAHHGLPTQFPDTENLRSERARNLARARGVRSILYTPLMNGGTAIGLITVGRADPGAFADHHVRLLQTFADQAVIAIENARMFNETREALERQTATADILKVIASSPIDVRPVLDAIAEIACKLCEATDAAVRLVVGGGLEVRAHRGPMPVLPEALPIDRDVVAGRAVLEKSPVHVRDIQSCDGDGFPKGRDFAQRVGARTVLAVPLLRRDQSIGVIVIRRAEARGFSDKQIALLQTFADQAVIAIENARLFEEVQARTSALSEALETQTATSEVLQVISRSAYNLDAVLRTLVETAARLCRAGPSEIYRRVDDDYRLAAIRGVDIAAYREIEERGIIRPGRGSLVGRVALEARPVQIADAWTDMEYEAKDDARLGNVRSMLGVPLLREGELIGAFALGRDRVEPFSSREVELVTTFADQAVIAIENARMFNETQEALERQTATADILKVISRSAFDLQKVLDTLTESAAKLCGADLAAIVRQGPDGYYHASRYNFPAAWAAVSANVRLHPGRGSLVGRTVLEGRPVQIEDVLADREYTYPDQQAAGGYRTLLGVPMLREGQAIGVLFLGRTTVRTFADKQIELISTFADQAVIAIENARLFDEVQARTEDLRESLQQQTATADVLKTISRSAFDLKTVLQALVESATRLVGADKGTIARKRGDAFYREAFYGFSDEFRDRIMQIPIMPERGSVSGRALLDGKTVHIVDIHADPEYTLLERIQLDEFSAILGVPMLREGEPIGIMALTRNEPKAFTDKEIELATTFADQAAIAIENVRLFEQVESRTRELAQSLDDLRAAQDRLVQTEKLASLGQLTAGIAHEIKNPLNFVNNFSSVSAEILDELGGVLKGATLGEAARTEVDELTAMLKGNLDKVVQHGRRADSIVKNMLLHARAGSGERRVTEINPLVEDSLNLAYHGARAEKSGFNVTIERDLDPSAGSADVLPQEIMRVLLNLVTNGFYAVTQRKAQGDDTAYEPTLRASTRALEDAVEIRIRDNGTGIPDEVKAKMFNPFFTTKPPGEGTGLGLSLSHDIIVKQHGGAIEALTEPGHFTEFVIRLPRARREAQGESHP